MFVVSTCQGRARKFKENGEDANSALEESEMQGGDSKSSKNTENEPGSAAATYLRRIRSFMLIGTRGGHCRERGRNPLQLKWEQVRKHQAGRSSGECLVQHTAKPSYLRGLCKRGTEAPLHWEQRESEVADIWIWE